MKSAKINDPFFFIYLRSERAVMKHIAFCGYIKTWTMPLVPYIAVVYYIAFGLIATSPLNRACPLLINRQRT